MIHIRRLPLPVPLVDQLNALTEVLIGHGAQARRFARDMWNRNRLPRRALRDVLNQMAPGYQRCMYCGDSQGTSVDHFEPVSLNPLRTFDWLNHLLACSFCNSDQKGARYPIDEEGNALLIDPTVDDPFDHLVLSLSGGEYRARTRKGTETIAVLALNRGVLVTGRLQARAVVSQALRQWWESDAKERERQVRTIHMQPLADVCQAMLRYAVAPGAPQIFAAEPDLLDILRAPELRARLLA
jgi:uncharacterized protein (TIGR02646 family)